MVYIGGWNNNGTSSMKKLPNTLNFGNINTNNDNSQQTQPKLDQKQQSKTMIKTLALGNIKEKDHDIVLTYQNLAQDVITLLWTKFYLIIHIRKMTS